MQGFFQHAAVQIFDFNVHLTGRNTVGRSGYLKVHIAQMVFVAQNVGQYYVPTGFFVPNQAHGNTGHLLFDLNTGIHQRHTTGTNRSHRRRAVGFQHIGNHTNGVGRIRGYHGFQSPLCQMPVSDFPTRSPTQGLYFAGGERRKIIMQIETFFVLERNTVDDIHIHGCTQRYLGQGLGFAPGKNGRTMYRRQIVHFGPNGSYFFGFAAVEAFLFVQNQIANGFFLNLGKIFRNQFSFFVERFFVELFLEFFLDGIEHFFAFLFACGLGGNGIDAVVGKVMHFLVKFFILFTPVVFALGLRFGHLGGKFLLRLDLLANGLMGKIDGVEHFLFAHFVHLPFDHGNRVVGAAHNQVDIGFFDVLYSGIDHEFTVLANHTHFGNGPVERNIRHTDGRRSRQTGQGIGLNVFVVRQQRNHHLRIVAIVLGKGGS